MTKKAKVQITASPKLIEGEIFEKAIVDDGYRPMFFPKHVPDMTSWKEEFRIGNITKKKNINVEGSIDIVKDEIYYIPKNMYGFVALKYSPKHNGWVKHGLWLGNAYPRETQGQYEELVRYTSPISEKDVENILHNNSFVSDFENKFKNLSPSEKEEVSKKIFKLIKEFI